MAELTWFVVGLFKVCKVLIVYKVKEGEAGGQGGYGVYMLVVKYF